MQTQTLMTPKRWKTFLKADRKRWAKETPLAWVLEYQPTILLPGKGLIPFVPWYFQQVFLACRDRFRIINKPRQCGISTTTAADVAWEFDNIPGSQIVIISKDKDAAENFHAYVYQILRSVRQNNPDSPKLLKTNQRVTTNDIGSKITSLASSKEAGRSFTATHLVFDELAFIEYAEQIWQAANATLSQTGGRVTAISTPKGRANLFARIFEVDGNMGFTTFSFAWWDVPTYNPYYKQYMASKNQKEKNKWIAKAKTGKWYLINRPKYTELAWMQEFEGAFDVSEDMVFTTRQLEKTFWRNWMPEERDALGICDLYYRTEPVKGHDYVSGVDVGRKRDPTVIITYDITLVPAEIAEFKYIPAGNADYPLIEESIRQTEKDYFHPEMQIDATGAGDPLAEALSDVADSFIFTLNSKRNIIETTKLAMDNGALKMPKIKVMFQEHQKYVWDDRRLRQDTVMANSLAVDLFYETDDSFVGADPDFNYMNVGF